MIYKDWSDEFGVRLQKITGVSSEFYREYFDYVKKTYKPESIFIISEDTFVLPIVKTAKDIVYVLGDIDIFNADKLFNQDLSGLSRYGLTVTDNARQEYVMLLRGSFREHLKSLERVGRCYSKCLRDFDVVINDHILIDDSSESFYDSYMQYWKCRGEITMEFSIFKKCLTEMGKSNKSYTVEVRHNGVSLALGYFVAYDNELCWYETIRTLDEKYSKYSVGNFVLLKALEELCYKLNINLNLGATWFDYKKHWHPVIKNIRGLNTVVTNV